MHLIAVVCVWLSIIPWPASLALSALVLLHLASRHLIRRNQIGREYLVFSEATGWVLEGQGRAAMPLIILPDSVVSPWLIILHAGDGSRSRRWVIARDSMDAEGFRALRVTLHVTAASTLQPAAGQPTNSAADSGRAG